MQCSQLLTPNPCRSRNPYKAYLQDCPARASSRSATSRGRQRHEDGFGTPAGLQAEQCAAVPHQVEFNIAAATVSLEIAFALAVGGMQAALQDRHVGVEEMIADAFRQIEAGFEIRLA